MKILLIIALSICLLNCGYTYKVKSLSNEALCQRLGLLHLREHEEGIKITKSELNKRNYDKDQCTTIANREIENSIPAYKQDLCERLTGYNYKGDYTNFKKTLDTISRLGFADDECITIGEFYMTRLTRKQERLKAISNALNEAIKSMERRDERLYGKGTRYNPIHINVQTDDHQHYNDIW